MFDLIKDNASHRLMAFASPDERVFGLYLLMAAMIGVVSWAYYRYMAKPENKPDNVQKGLLGFVFDKDVFLHKSAIQDYFYFVTNAVIYVGIVSQLLISIHFFMMLFSGVLNGAFGVPTEPIMQVSLLSVVLYTLAFALAMDFAVFITHYLQHKIPLLWQFHQVHHSAEVLTPMTIYRMHPVDLFFTGLVGAMLVGLAYAGFTYLTQATPTAYEIMGLNVIVFVFYFLGYNLRHSHIWLNYPSWLSHIFISPAQHHIHHSVQRKHWDKNMGLIFAFWDKLFGTLYVPKTYEKLKFGLDDKVQNPFGSVWEMYVTPFKNAWAIIVPPGSKRGAALTALTVLLVSGGVYYAIATMDRGVQAQLAPLRSVHLEDLTWTEVERAMQNEGYDTVLIPTGGTEQNGAHMIIGKHNKVVYYTAEKIAERLGRTFVAPVMPYVPEEVHMDYAGTVSVSDGALQTILQEAAESYLRQGFTNVFFIGDSVGNQTAQEQAAQALAAEWPEAQIAHIGNYYSQNGQYEWLTLQGYKHNQIGGHAGIRDTSEMMVVDGANGIRKHLVFIPERQAGHNGDYKKASKSIGRKMLEMKIDAAVKQIESLIGERQAEPKASDIVTH